MYTHMFEYLEINICPLTVVIFCFRQKIQHIFIMVLQKENKNLSFNYLHISKVLW